MMGWDGVCVGDGTIYWSSAGKSLAYYFWSAKWMEAQCSYIPYHLEINLITLIRLQPNMPL